MALTPTAAESWLSRAGTHNLRAACAAMSIEPSLACARGWANGVRPSEMAKDDFADLRLALWRASVRLAKPGPVLVPWYGETVIELPLNSESALNAFVYGSYEPAEMGVLIERIGRGSTCIDVGANAGLYTVVLAAHVGSTGEVLAVEPSARERRTLRRNIQWNDLNSVVRIEPRALSSVEGQRELKLASLYNSGHNTLGEFQYSDTRVFGVEVVATTTIDALVSSGSGMLHAVKIDVEGHELEVLAGASQVLGDLKPPTLVELPPVAAVDRATRVMNLITFMAGFGLFPGGVDRSTGGLVADLTDKCEYVLFATDLK